MEQFKLVSPDKLESAEQYANSLVTAVLSLQTLEAFEIQAYKKGLLDEDETETSKTIIWELKRLMGLYKTQLDLVVAHMPEFTQDKVIEWMKSQLKK